MSSRHLPMFYGVPLRKQELRSAKDSTMDRHPRNLVIGWMIFGSIMLVNILIFAKQKGWW